MNQSKSTTNFDLSSLHLLRDEIDTVLKDAETHLRDFYDDPEQAALLLDSANNLNQLSAIFELISFDGAYLLTKYLSNTYSLLHHNIDGDEYANEVLMTDISEAVMLLARYTEFVLLKETPEPALLLPIINKLQGHLGENPIDHQILKQESCSVIIANPQTNYASLSTLGLNTKALIQAYRTGLSVILEQKEHEPLSEYDKQKLIGMAKSCAIIAQKSDTLFWQAAAVLTENIANDLPLSHAKKRILIYLEQQFSDYLPIEDRRFAEMVSFACRKNGNFAKLAHQKYTLNSVGQARFEQMQRFLFGPNREIIDTLNVLIQEQIETIKQNVDTFVRNTNGLGDINNQVSIDDISVEIANLSRTLHLLELNDASKALQSAATQVRTWQTPTLEDLDDLLDKLMIAENAAIFLVKSHTPGAVKLPLYNREISLHQLDNSYETLVKEARINLASISLALTTYLSDANRDILNLQNTTEMVRQVAGAATFLRMDNTAKQLYRLTYKLDNGLLEQIKIAENKQLTLLSNAWADVLVAADYEFENFEQNRPSNKQALLIGEHSLGQLLSA